MNKEDLKFMFGSKENFEAIIEDIIETLIDASDKNADEHLYTKYKFLKCIRAEYAQKLE